MFTLPQLPYGYDALEPHIDAKTMEIHHTRHHATYIKNLNDALSGHDKFLKMNITELVTKFSEIPENIRAKVQNNAGGHYNHSLFWEIMTPKSAQKPAGELGKAIVKVFGSFANFQEKFSAAATGRFGSGWAWLAVDGGKLVIIDTPNQDSPFMNMKIPILGLDVWEHAYYLKYQNKRVDYISAWWNVVNWEEADKRFLDSLEH